MGAKEFDTVKIPPTKPLPGIINVHLTFAGGLGAGARVEPSKVPANITGTDLVLGYGGTPVPEVEFRRQVAAEFC